MEYSKDCLMRVVSKSIKVKIQYDMSLPTAKMLTWLVEMLTTRRDINQKVKKHSIVGETDFRLAIKSSQISQDLKRVNVEGFIFSQKKLVSEIPKWVVVSNLNLIFTFVKVGKDHAKIKFTSFEKTDPKLNQFIGLYHYDSLTRNLNIRKEFDPMIRIPNIDYDVIIGEEKELDLIAHIPNDIDHQVIIEEEKELDGFLMRQATTQESPVLIFTTPDHAMILNYYSETPESFFGNGNSSSSSESSKHITTVSPITPFLADMYERPSGQGVDFQTFLQHDNGNFIRLGLYILGTESVMNQFPDWFTDFNYIMVPKLESQKCKLFVCDSTGKSGDGEIVIFMVEFGNKLNETFEFATLHETVQLCSQVWTSSLGKFQVKHLPIVFDGEISLCVCSFLNYFVTQLQILQPVDIIQLWQHFSRDVLDICDNFVHNPNPFV